MKVDEEKLANKSAYQDMVWADDVFRRKALHIAELLGYGHRLSDIDFQFCHDKVWVSWEEEKGWGAREKFDVPFPVSYLWMSDEEICGHLWEKDVE